MNTTALFKTFGTLFIYAVPLYTLAQTSTIHVLSATVKDQNIAGAEVFLQKNGANSSKSVTNQQGIANIAETTAEHLLIIKKPNYSTLVTKCPCDGRTYALSPVLKNLDSMRIVLNWGKTPDDLDSHLVYDNEHIFWDAKTGDKANLDVDDIDSYGPETITIEQRLTNQPYVYAVHNYSDINQANSNRLARSQATVRVYMGESLVRSYDVPNTQGNLWTVFRITPNGEIQDINHIQGLNTDNQHTIAQKIQNYSSSAYTPIVVSTANQNRAKTLTLQGDKAYQAKNLEQAVMLYQQAIDYNPNAAQTYSSIALVYQKLGRSSEALWANRKAIELATNNNTKAYSHYNMGRVYEDNGRTTQALYHYQQADQFKPSKAYAEAILRVR